MPKNEVEMGWAARPMKEQHPALPDGVAEDFDDDNQQLVRLKLRGLLTPSEADRARQRYVKNVEKALRKILPADHQLKEPR